MIVVHPGDAAVSELEFLSARLDLARAADHLALLCRDRQTPHEAVVAAGIRVADAQAELVKLMLVAAVAR